MDSSQQPNGTSKSAEEPSSTAAASTQVQQTQSTQQTSQPTQSQASQSQSNQQASAQQHKPRDVRLLHSLLASQGVSSYQDRVPLMLLDFAYRYTRSVLSDAQQLAWEGYGTHGNTNQNSGRAADAPTDVSLQALRLAAQGRQIVLGS